MTHIQQPAMKHCLAVSQALHKKFSFLGSDEGSEVVMVNQLLNFIIF